MKDTKFIFLFLMIFVVFMVSHVFWVQQLFETFFYAGTEKPVCIAPAEPVA